ncbi:redoxin domain-containing protein [Pontibacter sp. BT310]|uniref:Redoxin domain-containing protein n=1 Tax=Pontibacter populi TaxID=890055 RepID=A0ABS6X9M7_9BACT|nr:MULTISPECIES: thioredoxin-like domain-containing protein [Pontibacter]MBJ6117817.1 redoxin domain-containing protein [Pontibacter sp. BT310]MBR0570243.1 redoxin domain-containing protein [Microvirga sp. STS03]MBW3364669.1 redoxin domain-containing protein [Pontibacter populi]
MLTGRVNAPDLTTAYGWLNTDRDWSIKDLRGKIVLLDFWTFGCINCQHIVPDLKRLEEEFADVLVVIGVHSAKFDAEKQSETIKQAIRKFGIEHPVVNDADYKLWDQYGIKAWPTIVLIDPNGKVVGQHAGESVYDTVHPYIQRLKGEFKESLNYEPVRFHVEHSESTILSFPSKLISDNEGNIYLSDSGHNRVLKLNQQGKILEIIGSGEQGFNNGGYADSTFYEPHGLVLLDDTLYIADAKNNAIRKVDLKHRMVTTAAGTGELEYYFLDEKDSEPVNSNSPWDLLIHGQNMFIASAGNHQVLRMDLETGKIYRFAGSGREALTDGHLLEAAFNQPSGLAISGDVLFVADAEASAIRSINLSTGIVRTPLGRGLFDFGDVDGDVDDALLQHCVGVEIIDSDVYIADTYNGKVKVLDLSRKRIHTLAKGLHEPNDLIFLNGKLWVTSTNSHQLFKIDLNTGEKEEVIVG